MLNEEAETFPPPYQGLTVSDRSDDQHKSQELETFHLRQVSFSQRDKAYSSICGMSYSVFPENTQKKLHAARRTSFSPPAFVGLTIVFPHWKLMLLLTLLASPTKKKLL